MENEKLIGESPTQIRSYRSTNDLPPLIAFFIFVIMLCIILPIVLRSKPDKFIIVSVNNITNNSAVVNIKTNKNEPAELVLVSIYGNHSIGIVKDEYFNYYPNPGRTISQFTHNLTNLNSNTYYMIYLSEYFHVTSNKFKFCTISDRIL